MSKPNYRVSVAYDADRKVFLARVPELEHCTGEGATRAEAIAKVEEEIDAQLANMVSHGTTPPRSVDEEIFSGEVACKVSRGLHRDLVFQARAEGVDIDHLVGELLAAALEPRKQSQRAQRSGNRQPHEPQHHDNIGNRHDGPGRRQGGFGGGGRGNYHAVMDDRANFIEYVRGLENGGHGGGRGPGMGGGGAGGGGDRRRRRGRGGGGGGGNGNRPDHRGQHMGGGGGYPAQRNGGGPSASAGGNAAPASGSEGNSAPAQGSGSDGGDGNA
jgi:predicted RNase H-like HicB family nuclease